MFRIAGGMFKGKKLVLPPNNLTRPSSARAREALFDVLFSQGITLHACHFLDGFAGSGAVGIEALSRGAKSVTCVENNLTVQKILRKNLATLSLKNHALYADFEHVVQPVDVVFLDPPYHLKIGNITAYAHALEVLECHKKVHPETLIVIETDAKEECILPAHYIPLFTKVYGAAKFHFFRFSDAECADLI